RDQPPCCSRPIYLVGRDGVPNELFKNALRLARMFYGLRRSGIDGRANADDRYHTHSVMWRTFDAVNAFHLNGIGNLLVDLALECFRTVGKHALDRFGIVALVGGDE